jgi:hypothetical protein
VPEGGTEIARTACRKGDLLVYTVPILIIAMCVAIVALIYWGGFREEARNK